MSALNTDTVAQRSAAFFDLDKTLMQGSSAFQFGRAAHRAGMITRRQLASSAIANVRFRLRGASDERSQAVREGIATSLRGVRVRELERLGVSVLARILPRLYPQMVSIAHDHQDDGRRVYIVTAAADELAEMLARVMGFDGGIGSHLSEVVDGRYTGRATGAFLYGTRRRRRSARSPLVRASISPTATPTRTLPPTCRCSSWSDTRSRSIQTPSSAHLLVSTAGRCCAGSALPPIADRGRTDLGGCRRRDRDPILSARRRSDDRGDVHA